MICETRPRRSAVRVETTTGSSSSPRARAHAPMLEAKTPASARKPSRDDGEEEAADPAAVDDDVGASTVKGGASGEAREMLTATPVPVPGSGDDSARRRTAPGASPPDERETAWWGEDLAARLAARGDLKSGRDRDTIHLEPSCSYARDFQDELAVRNAPPFSAARTARGRLAGDGAVRCFACGGEYTRNEMVLLSRCGHPLCLSCAEAWAEKRGRRCATCKNVIDGWHFGEKHFSQNGTAGWRVAFRALTPERIDAREPDPSDPFQKGKKRKPARSARALAFDGVGGSAEASDGGSADSARATSADERSGGAGKRRRRRDS